MKEINIKNLVLLTKQEQEQNWQDKKIFGFNVVKQALADPNKLFERNEKSFTNKAMLDGIAGELYINTNYNYDRFIKEKEFVFYNNSSIAPAIQFQIPNLNFILNAQPDVVAISPDDRKLILVEIKTSKHNLDKLQKDYLKQMSYYAYVAKLAGFEIEKYYLQKVNPKNMDEIEEMELDVDNLLTTGETMFQNLQKIFEIYEEKDIYLDLNIVDEKLDIEINDLINQINIEEDQKNKILEQVAEFDVRIGDLKAKIEHIVLNNGNTTKAFYVETIVKKTKYKSQPRIIEKVEYNLDRQFKILKESE